MQIVGAIIIGAIAGFIARWISPSPNNPQGFVLTMVLGIVGSVVATFLGRAIHWYGPDQGGLIASIVGAVIVGLMASLCSESLTILVEGAPDAGRSYCHRHRADCGSKAERQSRR